jgi:four helix bundle protein
MIGLSDNRMIGEKVRKRMSHVIEVETSFVQKVSDLRVYQLAFSVSLEIHKASLCFPKIEQYALADQMRRASKSICANLAEGFAKQSASEVEFKRFLSIAIGSSDEMQVWIQYAYALEYIDEKQFSDWEEKYQQISRMLTKLQHNK